MPNNFPSTGGDNWTSLFKGWLLNDGSLLELQWGSNIIERAHAYVPEECYWLHKTLSHLPRFILRSAPKWNNLFSTQNHSTCAKIQLPCSLLNSNVMSMYKFRDYSVHNPCCLIRCTFEVSRLGWKVNQLPPKSLLNRTMLIILHINQCRSNFHPKIKQTVLSSL